MYQNVSEIEEEISKLEKKLRSISFGSPETKGIRNQIQELELEKERIQPPERQEKEFCFVIMPSNEALQPVYNDAIKPAVESEGLECLRADEIPSGGSILRDFVEYTHKAKVIIVDLTGMNPGVFYELGISHALGNNVIMLAQNIKDDVPFDLNNYRVIPYKIAWGGDKELKKEIQTTIKALDKWTQKPSNPVQDFLSPDARPVPGGEHKAVKQQLEKIQQELKDAESWEDKYKVQEKDLNQLREEYKAVKQELEKVQQEQKDIQIGENEYKTQEDELKRLKEENMQFQMVRQFMEALFQSISGNLDEGISIDEMLKRFYAEMDKRGEVMVSMPPSSGKRKTGMNTDKIRFRKVNEKNN